MNLRLQRTYRAADTIGQLSADGQTLGATIEDIGRPYGVKIPGETCIPEGNYRAKITYSEHFGRDMILLYTDPKTLACKEGGVEFTGIRIHKGIKTSQTEGCLLYQGDLPALELMVQHVMERGESVLLTIERAPA